MKKLLVLIVLAAAALPLSAQRPDYEFSPHKRLPEYEFKLPDSLSHMVPWLPEFEESMRPKSAAPVVSMSSVVVLQGRKTPRRVVVTERNVLQMPHLTISNGQAGNWGPYPDSYLDARTISLPL